MNKTFSESKINDVCSRLEKISSSFIAHPSSFERSPVHVVYGGAHLFTAETTRKLGNIALQSLENYAANFGEFARAMWLKGADVLPPYADVIADLENEFAANEARAKEKNYDAWFARAIYRRTIQKLKREPIEDFRIDFEDGYGLRADAEEDSHAVSASNELAKAFLEKTITEFCGFRIKSFQKETCRRAVRTLELFLTNLSEKCGGALPENFAVTLPKIKRAAEVAMLTELLGEFETRNDLENGAIKIEIMIETPESIVGADGAIALRKLVEAGNGRVNSAHFGAYDYTAGFGIAAEHQHLRHEACRFARQMMQISLAPLNIRLSDSVTTEMPVPVHRSENLSARQIADNQRAVHKAWRAHFNNVTQSLVNGFYQSWDLHPAQLPARYAAIYSFFLESKDSSARRLKGFLEKATQANLTGNTFDDAASAQELLNFFTRAKSCGAMTGTEISNATGLNAAELDCASFLKIMKSRSQSK